MTPSNKNNWLLPAGIAAFVIICVCCLCLVILAGAGLLAFIPAESESGSSFSGQVETTDTPVVIRPTRQPTRTPSAPQAVQPSPAVLTPEAPALAPDTAPLALDRAAAAAQTLRILREAVIPPQDPAELAKRLEGKGDTPPTLEPQAPGQVGDVEQFWVADTDTNENFQVQAVLRYVTDHAYFWIEDGVSYRESDLRQLAETFESQIYPTNREFFGSEWSPGVDGDVRLYILYARGLGSGIAGYFSSIDSINPAIMEYSNGHEMFVFNADGVSLRDDYTAGVLAHEFQHMIHWYRDINEATWLNEGFSDLAMLLNGYDIGGHDILYAMDPDLQLNDWPSDQDETLAHYGASFLFVTYFLDRFGEQATQALVGHPDNDLASIDQVLSDLGISDPLSGQTIGADDVFSDWVLASYLQDGDIADGRYTYTNYPGAPQPFETESLGDCAGSLTRDVRQYGVDYIQLRCGAPVTLRFEGSLETRLLPADPYSGSNAFWSNKGDSSSISLEQSFDFSNASGPLTFSYWTWYDIEVDFDYLYLLASEDGQNWEIIQTPSGTADDPTGANYGWGYNGLSGNGPEWIQEEIDLSRYAGRQVTLRFEYITDGAVYAEGFLLDDVAIPQIGYFSDFESDDGGWQAAGFVRVQNVLPQTFEVSLIRKDGSISVEHLQLSPENDAEISLDFGGRFDEAVLVVSGTTRYTRQPAAYRLVFP